MKIWSELTGNRKRQTELETVCPPLRGEVTNLAYESDFGAVRVVANRFQRARDCLVLEMDKWAVAYLKGRKMVKIPLARTGDNERFQMLSEYTLEARNEKASGGVFDLTTS